MGAAAATFPPGTATTTIGTTSIGTKKKKAKIIIRTTTTSIGTKKQRAKTIAKTIAKKKMMVLTTTTTMVPFRKTFWEKTKKKKKKKKTNPWMYRDHRNRSTEISWSCKLVNWSIVKAAAAAGYPLQQQVPPPRDSFRSLLSQCFSNYRKKKKRVLANKNSNNNASHDIKYNTVLFNSIR